MKRKEKAAAGNENADTPVQKKPSMCAATAEEAKGEPCEPVPYKLMYYRSTGAWALRHGNSGKQLFQVFVKGAAENKLRVIVERGKAELEKGRKLNDVLLLIAALKRKLAKEVASQKPS